MGPCVHVITWAECAIGVLVCEGPEDILSAVTHVLCVSNLLLFE